MKKKTVIRELSSMGALYAHQCQRVRLLEAENFVMSRLLFRVADEAGANPTGDVARDVREFLELPSLPQPITRG